MDTMPKDANMTPEARAVRAAYMREWRRRNPGKERAYNVKKWERKAQQIVEAAKIQDEQGRKT